MQHRTCECPRCQNKSPQHYVWCALQTGDRIRVYSAGHLLKPKGIFLHKERNYVHWLDIDHHFHTTHIDMIHIEKIDVE
ncbi:hypothetical protein BVH75_30345 (plasmid) [Bacillus thuringiensis]|nr:hypothetical protein BVH75_30115 [Bacillus thuringiensis]ARX70224.1 hypothetical protein BVH75_30345 [Bacillus thuringiensis]